MTTTLEPTTAPPAGTTPAQDAPTRVSPGTDVRPVRRSYGPGRATRRARGSVGVLVLLAAWVVGSATGLIDPRILAAPWQVASAFGELVASGRLQESLVASLTRAGIGIAAGVAAGVALALLAGLSRWASR